MSSQYHNITENSIASTIKQTKLSASHTNEHPLSDQTLAAELNVNN